MVKEIWKKLLFSLAQNLGKVIVTGVIVFLVTVFLFTRSCQEKRYQVKISKLEGQIEMLTESQEGASEEISLWKKTSIRWEEQADKWKNEADGFQASLSVLPGIKAENKLLQKENSKLRHEVETLTDDELVIKTREMLAQSDIWKKQDGLLFSFEAASENLYQLGQGVVFAEKHESLMNAYYAQSEALSAGKIAFERLLTDRDAYKKKYELRTEQFNLCKKSRKKGGIYFFIGVGVTALVAGAYFLLKKEGK